LSRDNQSPKRETSRLGADGAVALRDADLRQRLRGKCDRHCAAVAAARIELLPLGWLNLRPGKRGLHVSGRHGGSVVPARKAMVNAFWLRDVMRRDERWFHCEICAVEVREHAGVNDLHVVCPYDAEQRGRAGWAELSSRE
jgi:hypothetical protein